MRIKSYWNIRSFHLRASTKFRPFEINIPFSQVNKDYERYFFWKPISLNLPLKLIRKYKGKVRKIKIHMNLVLNPMPTIKHWPMVSFGLFRRFCQLSPIYLWLNSISLDSKTLSNLIAPVTEKTDNLHWGEKPWPHVTNNNNWPSR